jgi:hypothetical protein
MLLLQGNSIAKNPALAASHPESIAELQARFSS